jgi:two-component system OmpR family response regulator
MKCFWNKSKDQRRGTDELHHVPRGRVLVVEDDRITSRLVSLILLREGYEVAAAGDGSEALMEAKRFSPDVMVLDLMLPSAEPGGGQFDGFGVLEWLNMRLSKPTPTIVLTCRQDEAARRLADSLGVRRYLTKPFRAQDLISAVYELNDREQPSTPPAPSRSPH